MIMILFFCKHKYSLKQGKKEKQKRLSLQLTEQTLFVSRAFLALGEIYQSQERFEEAIHVLENASTSSSK